STSMMSIPLASTWVRLWPSCGRARAITKIANVAKINARRNFPARAALCLPIARKVDVDEKVSAAAGPRLPRKYARSGIASRSRSSHGRANVSAVFCGHQSSKCKLLSFHKTRGLFEQQPAISRTCIVTGEFDQVAPIQKILEQRFFIRRERF